MGLLIDRPTHDLEIIFAGICEKSGSDEVAADCQLAGADFYGALDGIFELAFEEEAGHQCWLDFAERFENRGVEGNYDGAGDFTGTAKSPDQGVFAAPGAGRFQFQIEDDVMFFGELENFFERGDALAGKFAAEPGAGVEAAEFGQGEIVNFAFAVCGAVDGVVMDGDEAGVAGELEIGFDEGGAERDGAAEGGQSVFGRVAGGASMCDYEHG